MARYLIDDEARKAETVSISQVVTLEPGDPVFAGTSGVPAQIMDGDAVEVEIEGIGALSNPVRLEM